MTLTDETREHMYALIDELSDVVASRADDATICRTVVDRCRKLLDLAQSAMPETDPAT